jgi:multidrug efflux pump subunit AcrB
MARRKRAVKSPDRRLARMSLYFFNRPLKTLILWLILVGFGLLCYLTLMGRQGFPPVQAPLSIVHGAYFVNDPQKVDAFIDKPISEIALKQKDVKSVTATANANTFDLLVEFKEGANPKKSTQKLEDAVRATGRLPKTAQVLFQTIDVGKYSPQNESFDMLIAVYGDGASTDQLVDKAKDYAARINYDKLSYVANANAVSPYSEGVNPQTGEKQKVQTSFDRYIERVNGKPVFHNDVVIGLTAKNGADAVKLYNQVKDEINTINNDKDFKGYHAAITAAFAIEIQQDIGELQRTLLEGLIAVLILGTILISWRASILVIASMGTVIAITLGGLYLIGYTLNVITLFAIILGLALIVDDTIIMTEAIDVERRRRKDAQETVRFATNKVSLAMLAATSTAILGFAPIIFITGILGGFIRPIPITIIISLIISLLVALTVIPFIARYLILRGKNSIGPGVKVPLPVRWQESFAHILTGPLRWANHHRKRLWLSGIAALIIGFGFIFAGAFIFKFVTFNIFPPNKDSNQLQVVMQFPAGTDITKAEAVTDKADRLITKDLGPNLNKLTYYGTGGINRTYIFIELTPYSQRSVASPQLVDKLDHDFKNFPDATVSVSANDVGGPPGSFNVLVETTDRDSATRLANDMTKFLSGAQLKRADGSTARITKAYITTPDSYLRKDGKQLVQVTAEFDATDTSTLVTLAQDKVKAHYTNAELSKFNLSRKNLVYDFGFENENQKSFNSMLVAFPILLVIMYLVLAFEFRSLLQPLLIFMAIPFSFFGVTGGLWLTNNPFSFFTMLGFFALVGLSIKNTILLTDYANQARKAGLGRVDSIISAVEERFRPLLATSATAVFSLLPLALASPFWEALCYTLIFGLLSSTALVILVFPYYYLGAEYLRLRIRRRSFFRWLLFNGLLAAIVTAIYSTATALQVIAGLNLLLILRQLLKARKRSKIRR